jgi:glycine/D-amino acid oxidase-like deaminating enzyme
VILANDIDYAHILIGELPYFLLTVHLISNMVLRCVVPTELNDSAQPPQVPFQTTTPQILPVPNPVTSYWLSEPDKYANLRSTPDLLATCDIAIIGSGMAGVLTAYHIFKNAGSGKVPSVVLLEARQLCSGATGRNGGHIKVKTATLASLATGEERNELQGYVLRVINSIKRVVDDDDLAERCEFEIRRSFDVFQDEEEFAAVKQIYDEARKKGERWTQNISTVDANLAAQVTSIRDAIGAFNVPAASLWPYKFVTGVLSRIISQYQDAINVQTNTPVISISRGAGINILETPRGTLKAGKIVFATNAYTSGLLPAYVNTITPVRGMATHIVPKQPVYPHMTNTYNIHFAPLPDSSTTGVDYLNPRPNGSIVVGGGAWNYKSDRSLWYNNFDDSTRFPASVEKHWDGYMQRSFLGWEDSEAKSDCTWTGIMGITPDGKPHVGRVVGADGREVEGQWMLAGFNGGGMAMIGVAAMAVAEMVLKDVGFGDVMGKFGLPGAFESTGERLRGK